MFDSSYATTHLHLRFTDHAHTVPTHPRCRRSPARRAMAAHWLTATKLTTGTFTPLFQRNPRRGALTCASIGPDHLNDSSRSPVKNTALTPRVLFCACAGRTSTVLTAPQQDLNPFKPCFRFDILPCLRPPSVGPTNRARQRLVSLS